MKTINIFDIRADNENSETLEMYIYSTVEGDECFEKSQTTSAQHFREELEKHKNAKYINLYINSTGGSVFEGAAIYSQLNRHNAKVTVFIDGFACSIASVIAMAGDKIIMSPNAVMMIHNAWCLASGNSQQLRKVADDLEVINHANKAAYLNKSGDKLTAEKLTEMLDNETYLTAQQCIEYGLCDEISTKVEPTVEDTIEMQNYKNSVQKVRAMLDITDKTDNTKVFKNLFKV